MVTTLAQLDSVSTFENVNTCLVNAGSNEDRVIKDDSVSTFENDDSVSTFENVNTGVVNAGSNEDTVINTGQEYNSNAGNTVGQNDYGNDASFAAPGSNIIPSTLINNINSASSSVSKVGSCNSVYNSSSKIVRIRNYNTHKSKGSPKFDAANNSNYRMGNNLDASKNKNNDNISRVGDPSV